MTDRANAEQAAMNSWRWGALAVGVVVVVVCLIGAYFAPAEFFRAYLFSYLFLLGLALGSLVLVMIHHLTGGVWGLLIRRILEAQMQTLPLLLVLFVPIGLGMSYVYPWANPAEEAVASLSWLQARYLTPTLFFARTIGYFVVWLGLAIFLSSWSRQQDRSDDPRIPWKCVQLSGPGLVLYGVTWHFAATDWIMSLQPEFTSTIFAPLVCSSQVLAAFGWALLIFRPCGASPAFNRLISRKATNDLGSLLFTLLVLWAYLAWFQFMLIWMANLPGGALWYVVRRWEGHDWLAGMLFVFFWILFFVLLFRAVKQNRRLLGIVGALATFVQCWFMYYLVRPAFPASSLLEHWPDVLVPVGLGALWLSCFLWLLQRRPLLPRHDLNYDQALHLREREEEEAAREEALAHG
jgi:hypothetical protein